MATIFKRVSPRAIAMRAIAVCIPFALLALVEVAFRLADIGADTRLFIEAGQPGYCVMNPDVSKRYFTNLADATIGNHEPFSKSKQKNCYRIFVLGESTALGYPYLRNGSFHRWLQYRLQLTFPGKKIEIINLALTAVNSFTIRDFADELAPYSPDAVLVYVGHNEYYGALGVRSTSSLGHSPALVTTLIALRRLRLVQWLTTFTTTERTSDRNVTLMQRMSEKSRVPYGSKLYRAGLLQFEVNMKAAMTSLQGAGIPVFWSTVACNDKDLRPFISDDRSEASAGVAYTKARQLYDTGQYEKARLEFASARMLDQLRFRAPDSINTIIRSMAPMFRGVRLVDTERTLRSLAPHGILGEEFFLEHVHPNLRGYAVMADAFYEVLREAGCIEAEWKTTISYDSILQVMPITAIDTLKAHYEVLMLREQWPFNEPMPPDTTKHKTTAERLAGALAVKQIVWAQAMMATLNEQKKLGNINAALRTAEALALENPENTDVLDEVTNLALQNGHHHKAVFYAKRSFSIQPKFLTAQTLFVELLKKDRPEEALPYLEYAQRAHTATVDLRELIGFTRKIISLKANLSGALSDAQTLVQVAGIYLQFANKQAALACINKSLQLKPHNASARAMREKIVAM